MTSELTEALLARLTAATRAEPPPYYEETDERQWLAEQLMDAMPVGSTSNIGGRDAVKQDDGTWTLEADEDLETWVERRGMSSRDVVLSWCCMHPSHWPESTTTS